MSSIHPIVARAELISVAGRSVSFERVRRITENDLPRRWDLYEEGCRYGEFIGTFAEAKAKARRNCDPANYGDTSESMWIDWEIRCSLTDEEESGTVECEPDEPECEPGHSHEWKSPHSVLGGLKENPGVWGKGGGVICKEVCCHCGKYRVTDTWAQRPDTGEQGLTSVRYEDADDSSMEWVQRESE